jgi:hypothetical protein
MTQATDSTASATLSGRELALKRRKAMALHGKAGTAKAASVSKPSARRVNPAPAAMSTPAAAASATASPSAASNNAPLVQAQSAASGGRCASRARRQAMSVTGKAALGSTATRPTGRVRPQKAAAMSMASPDTAIGSDTAPAADTAKKGCGCGCNGTRASCNPSAFESSTADSSASLMPAASTSSAASVIPAKQTNAPTGRALARARRAALSQDGKSGLKRVAQATKIASTMPAQNWEAAISRGATGRQMAMQRRLVQSLTGNSKPAAEKRPSGRMRTRMEIPAPPKVEEGHTLSGRGVTGTMVERSKKVTGNEPGSCRAITGTEYIGAEQFDTLCSTRPAPAPSKISVSQTSRERKVTGTSVDRSGNVTGNEPGSCRAVTGTEYASKEQFETICSTRPEPAPSKISVSQTSREHTVTGTSVDRSDKVTGNEPGSKRAITGTDYVKSSNGGVAPDKVDLSHTSHGKTVTGTAVGHARKITGDERGACRDVTGTEYLSMEQFKACNTSAQESPRKVSVMSSRGEQPVSGTAVGRSARVTGDEPGSCRAITGSQYYYTDSELCAVSAPNKVASMQTLGGRTVTGSEVGRSPKTTGDEAGGCKPVTGTDYIGADQQAAVCDVSTPVAPVAKVAVDTTWRGQPVTGSYVGRSTRVTGDEFGGCSPISGTPYIGRKQYSNFCEAPAQEAQEARIKTSALIPATAVTGDRPGAGGSVMTGDERGACEIVSGTPYVGSDNMETQCATSNRFVSRTSTWVEPPRPPAPIDFSIMSPARAAQQKAYEGVTGTGYSSERITGPVNKAGGLITGTPEFRHRDTGMQRGAQEEVVAAARRLTGEGSQAGRQITGDAWNAMSRVTGTEGASSQARNPSERGSPRGAGANAARFREEVEPAEVPPSRITGSAGNAGGGALVTLSGGARG